MKMKTRWALLLAFAASVPSGAAAQSVFGAAGLGLPVDALDARLRAIGSLGPGVMGSSLAPDDPSGAARLLLPSISGTMQPSWGDFEDGSESGELQGVRFPLIALAYPTRHVVVTASYGSYLDQRWAAERSIGFEIGGDSIQATDRFESNGGIATFRIGAARALGSRVAVGVSMGRHTGKVSRGFARGFDTLSAGSDVASFTDVAEWRFSGTVVSVGATFDPLPILRLGASATWNGVLTAEAKDDGVDRGETEFELPMEFRLGASARLTPRLTAQAGLHIADWTDADGGLEEISTSGRTVAFSGGVEATGVRFANRTLPLRLSYRRATLPYRPGTENPVESAIAAGLGLRLAEVEETTLAGLDLTLERGSRSADTLEESFWRMTLTLRLSGG